MSKQIVTGAFGYTGSYIARLLLARGDEVHSLSSAAPPSRTAVKTHPLNFEKPDALARALEGADVLYNTYWVRFNHKKFKHHEAVENSKILFKAAESAGVGRIVHVSITNPSPDSPFEYFRGKAELEEALKNSGVPFNIVRPAVLFGGRDILVNNICWALRRFPVMGLFGRGDYGLRPIFVEDLAALMIGAAEGPPGSTINAVGPERFSYASLCRVLAEIMEIRRPVLSCPPALAYAVGKMVGWLHQDVFITWPEVGGLMAGLLDTPEHFEAAPGRTLLTEWARKRKNELGRIYASELARRH